MIFANFEETKEFTNKKGRQEIEFETFAKPLEVRIYLVLKQKKMILMIYTLMTPSKSLKTGWIDEVMIQANFRRICMESSEQTGPKIHPPTCTNRLIFGKGALSSCSF